MVTIQKPSKKIVIILIILLLIAAAIVGYFLFVKNNPTEQKTTQTQPAQTQDSINLDPPTEEDKKNVEANKEEIVKRDEALKNEQTPGNTTSGQKTVTPSITYAGKYGDNVEVGGFVNGVFEDGGKCVATFTKDAQKITQDVAAVKNMNSMDCPAIIVPKTKFTSTGEWSVTLSYSSANASGVSESKKITVN